MNYINLFVFSLVLFLSSCVQKTKYDQLLKEKESLENELRTSVDPDVEKLIKEIIEEEDIKYPVATIDDLSKLNKKYDDISNITWYTDTSTTTDVNLNAISFHIGVSENNIGLRLLVSYAGDDWIFFDKLYLSFDGNTKEIPFDHYQKKTDSEITVCEWVDVPVNDDIFHFLTKMVEGNVLKYRLSGKYTKTFVLSQKQKKSLKNTMYGYYFLMNEKIK